MKKKEVGEGAYKDKSSRIQMFRMIGGLWLLRRMPRYIHRYVCVCAYDIMLDVSKKRGSR